jgi:putative transposase
MARFRDIKTLQKFVSAHASTIQASIHNNFTLERHLRRRNTFKENCIGALAEWRQLRPESEVACIFGDWFALD